MSRVNTYISRTGHILSHPYLTLATRIALGGTFIFAGVAKLVDIGLFVNLVQEYRLLHGTLVQIYGYTLPAVEVAIGVLIVLGLLLRLSASISILAIISFIVAKSFALYHGLEIPCGCFGPVGGAALELGTMSLALDFVLLALALQILLHKGDFLALGPWLLRRGEANHETTPSPPPDDPAPPGQSPY